MPNIIIFISHIYINKNHVGKVSTRFEYFASGFAALLVLMLNDVVLGAEFYGESNGVRVEGGCRA